MNNKKIFTNNDYLWAIRVQESQVTVRHPLGKDFIKILKASSLPNCPVTPWDVITAKKLFGPNIGALKGKTTHRGPPIVDSPISEDITSKLEYYDTILSMFRLCSCGTKPQRSQKSSFRDDVIMGTPMSS